MITILQKENKKLREVARPVPLQEITSPKIQKIIADMKTAMHSQDDAVAIAAPQIGMLFRIFVVSGRALLPEEKIKEIDEHTEIPADLVFINPKIIKKSKKEFWAHEGCLSIRWLYGEVKRVEKVTIRAYDENGKQFTRGASKLLAQIFQHETEHLEGKLFIDKARNIEEIPPEKNQEIKAKNKKKEIRI